MPVLPRVSLVLLLVSLPLTLPIGCDRLRALGEGQPAAGRSAPDAAPASDAAAVKAEPGAPLAFRDRFALGDAVTHGALTVWPVYSLAAARAADAGAIPLEVALTDGSVTVAEEGEGSVPTLQLTNAGKVPVLALAGDVVVGGKQDRILTETRLVQPGESVAVAVNCVEQGRWHAEAGKTFAYGGRAELDVRKTVRTQKDQGKTWEKVAEVNAEKVGLVSDAAKGALAPSTGTYRASLTSGEVAAAAQPVIAAVLPAVTRDPRSVGYVAALGDKMETVELYGSPGVFAAAAPSAVRSLALETLASTASGAPPDATAARAFLDQTFAGAVVARDEKGAAVAVETKAARSDGFVLLDATGEMLQAVGYAQ